MITLDQEETHEPKGSQDKPLSGGHRIKTLTLFHKSVYLVWRLTDGECASSPWCCWQVVSTQELEETAGWAWLARWAFAVFYNFSRKALLSFEWGGRLARCSLLTEVITAANHHCMLRGCSEKNQQCLLAALSPTDCLFSIFVGPYILDIFRASLKPRWRHGGLFRPSVLQNPLWSPRGAVLVLAQIRTDCRKSGVSTFIIFDKLTDDRIHRENKHEMFKLKTEWNKFLFFRRKREKPILYSEPTPTVIKDSQSTSAAYWVQHNILQILWNTQRARLGSAQAGNTPGPSCWYAELVLKVILQPSSHGRVMKYLSQLRGLTSLSAVHTTGARVRERATPTPPFWLYFHDNDSIIVRLSTKIRHKIFLHEC